VDFVNRNSKKLQKLGLKGKNESSPQYVHIAEFSSIFKVWKINNVLTYGLMAHVTLVLIIWNYLISSKDYWFFFFSIRS